MEEREAAKSKQLGIARLYRINKRARQFGEDSKSTLRSSGGGEKAGVAKRGSNSFNWGQIPNLLKEGKLGLVLPQESGSTSQVPPPVSVVGEYGE
jgi:hypothetical protein